MGPYERGWADAARGKTIRKCPYHIDSASAISWRCGWRDTLRSMGLL